MTNAGGVDGEEYGPCDDRHRGEEDHEQAQEAEEHVRVHAVLVELGSASWYRKLKYRELQTHHVRRRHRDNR